MHLIKCSCIKKTDRQTGRNIDRLLKKRQKNGGLSRSWQTDRDIHKCYLKTGR